MQIDFTPDPVQAPREPMLASDPRLHDTTGWTLVPATVQDERNFTAEDYEAASEGFQREGEDKLAMQAATRAAAMRQWLILQSGGQS